jgi:hypothetical protein
VSVSNVIDVFGVADYCGTFSEHDALSRELSRDALWSSQDAVDHVISYGDDLQMKI